MGKIIFYLILYLLSSTFSVVILGNTPIDAKVDSLLFIVLMIAYDVFHAVENQKKEK